MKTMVLRAGEGCYTTAYFNVQSQDWCIEFTSGEGHVTLRGEQGALDAWLEAAVMALVGSQVKLATLRQEMRALVQGPEIEQEQGQEQETDFTL